MNNTPAPQVWPRAGHRDRRVIRALAQASPWHVRVRGPAFAFDLCARCLWPHGPVACGSGSVHSGPFKIDTKPCRAWPSLRTRLMFVFFLGFPLFDGMDSTKLSYELDTAKLELAEVQIGQRC